MKKNNLWQKILLSEHFVLGLCLLLLIVVVPFIPTLLTVRNISNLLSNTWPLWILAIGQMAVLISGGIDLSQTSIMAVVSVIGGLLISSNLDPILFSKSPLWGLIADANGGVFAIYPWVTIAGIVIMLLVGTLIGIVNGLAVAKFKMPPFMVTLISMIFFSGLAIYITKSENVMNLPESFIAIGRKGILSIPFAFFIATTLAIVAHILFSKTLFGNWLFAIGKNIRAAIISGVPTEKVTIAAYAFSGFCAAIASILYSARLESGRPTLGQNLLLDVVGACVIGGISIYGGKGKVLWALYGSLFFVLLSNTLNFMNLSFYTIRIVQGAVILTAALIDVTRIKLLTHVPKLEVISEKQENSKK